MRLSTALWAERRLPALARLLRPSPVLPGEDGPLGTVYGAGKSGPLLVLVGDPGAEPRWLGSALATALGGIPVVIPASDTPGDGIAAAVAAAGSLGADPERVAVLGAGEGAAAALGAAAAAGSGIRRLVLLAPTSAPRAELSSVPPTFLQSSPQSPTLSVSRALEIDLRESGVAVRPVEYTGLSDAWVRYPRFAKGSKRAVEDILAFLRRGFGMDGTFSGVIPGWDLR